MLAPCLMCGAECEAVWAYCEWCMPIAAAGDTDEE
jgi:hypothetical protein